MTGDAIYEAQVAKVANSTGFFVGLDTHSSYALNVLKQYGGKNLETPEEIPKQLLAFKTRVVCDKEFNGESIVGVMIDSALMTTRLHGGQKIAKYLWKEKQVVPFLSLHGLAREREGVELIETEDLAGQVATASAWGVHGVKARCMIHAPNKEGIKAAIDQQREIAKIVWDHNLVPVIHLEVSIDTQDKAACEEILLTVLLNGLDDLEGEKQVIVVLTLPNTPNAYLPVAHHHRVIRLLALSGGYSRDDACTMLLHNVKMTACFGRALLEGLKADMADEEFSAALQKSCKGISCCCKETPREEEQLAKLSTQNGLIVTLDERAIASAETLQSFGYKAPKGGWKDDTINETAGRTAWRIVSDKEFKGNKILAVILSERLMDATVDGQTLPAFLWAHRRVVPMLQIDKHVHDGELRPDFEPMLVRAKEEGYFAVQLCTPKIKKTDKASMKTRMAEMFAYAERIRSAGLVPSLNMEVAPESPKKTDIEHLLLSEVTRCLGNLKPGEQVLLNLTLPSEANLYLPLTQNPCVVRVAGRYRGASRAEGCGHLAKCFGVTSAFGQAFTEGLNIRKGDEAFSSAIQKASDELYFASTYVPTQEIQAAKVFNSEGYIGTFDVSGGDQEAMILQAYGISKSELVERAHVKTRMRQMRERVISNPALNGTMAIAVTLSPEMLSQQMRNRPLPKYLWEVKKIVPFVSIAKGLKSARDGVQLMTEVTELEKVLVKALRMNVVGAKTCSVINAPNKDGISQVVKQHMQIARKVLDAGMVPLIQIAVESSAEEKFLCERELVLQLLSGLKGLRGAEKVLLWLSLPDEAQVYVPLLGHPHVARLIGLSGCCDLAESCSRLSQIVGMTAGFGQAMFEGLMASQSEEDFTATLEKSGKAMFEVSRKMNEHQLKLSRMATQEGFLANMDNSGEALRTVLQQYGSVSAGASEATLNAEASKMRIRLMMNSAFNGSRIIAVVLSEELMALSVERMFCAKYLWEVKKVIPFVRIDVGLMPESRGVCMMRNVEQVKAGVEKAVAFGCFGTKARILIMAPDTDGIKHAVSQQLEVAKCALAKGLVPIMQLEVDEKASDRMRCEQLLRAALASSLKQLDSKEQVILQFTLPVRPDSYSVFANHPNVLRAVARIPLGTNIQETCKEIGENQAFIGAFTFVKNLTVKQTEREFTRCLDASMDEVFLSCLGEDAIKRAPSKKSTDGSYPQRTQSSKTLGNEAPRATLEGLAGTMAGG